VSIPIENALTEAIAALSGGTAAFSGGAATLSAGAATLSAGGAALSRSESPRLDAQLLLSKVLDQPRVFLMTHPEFLLTDSQYDEFLRHVQQRATGYPIAYLLGQRDFWSLTLSVTSDTLIPRPETELLVELACDFLRSCDFLQSCDSPCVLDLGTGSGAIALAIAKEYKVAKVLATDISLAALQVAAKNAERNRVHNVSFVVSDWFSALQGSFSLIVSNPPYIASGDPHLLGDIRFEPQRALVSPKKGLADLYTIVSHSVSFLKRGGRIMLEHGFDQGELVRGALMDQGFSEVSTYRDGADLDRVSVGVLQ